MNMNIDEHGYVDKISDEVKVASSLDIKATYLEETPLPFRIKAAVRFDNQAQFHPMDKELEHIEMNKAHCMS